MKELDDNDRAVFVRLYVTAAISEAMVRNNPMPHLVHAARRNAALTQAIEDALLMLNGLDDLDLAVEAYPDRPPQSIQGMALLRNRRACARLRAATEPTGE